MARTPRQPTSAVAPVAAVEPPASPAAGEASEPAPAGQLGALTGAPARPSPVRVRALAHIRRADGHIEALKTFVPRDEKELHYLLALGCVERV